MRKLIAFASLPFVFVSLPASAQLSPSFRDLLEKTIAGGNDTDIDTMAKYLKQASPDDAAEIDKIIADHRTEIAAAKEEKLRHAGLFDNWKGEGQIGAYLSTGNTSTNGVTVGLNLTKEGMRWRYNFRALADYQRTEGVTSRNQWLVAFEPNYKIDDRLFAFGLLQYEKDRFQGFSSRDTVGGGLGYRVIAQPNLTLDVKAGPTWRHTNYIFGPNSDRLDALAGANLAWKISKTVSLSEAATAYVGSGDKTFMSLTALDAKLGGKLSARLSYQVNYETDPLPGIENTDTLTRFTLVYGF